MCLRVFQITMPPRRSRNGHPGRSNIEPQEQELPDAPEVQPQVGITKAEFLEAIRMLSQLVTNYVGQQRGARQKGINI